MESRDLKILGDLKILDTLNSFSGGDVYYSPHNSSHSSLDLNRFLLPP